MDYQVNDLCDPVRSCAILCETLRSAPHGLSGYSSEVYLSAETFDPFARLADQRCGLFPARKSKSYTGKAELTCRSSAPQRSRLPSHDAHKICLWYEKIFGLEGGLRRGHEVSRPFPNRLSTPDSLMCPRSLGRARSSILWMPFVEALKLRV